MAEVMSRSRPRVEEALDGAPAHPPAAVLALLLANRVVAEILDVLGGGLIALLDLEVLALEQRPLRQAERLNRRAVGGAEHLVAHRDDVGRLDGVGEDRLD